MILLLTAAHAQPPPPIVGGQPTAHPAVGALIGCDSDSDGTCQVTCTATLIDADWILTAAHCIDALPDGPAYFATGDASAPTAQVAVSAWLAHPDHGSRSRGDGTVPVYDIALGQLADSMPDTAPLSLGGDPVNSTWTGTSLTHVGYGITDDGASDAGQQRAAAIPVADYDNYNLYGIGDDGQNTCSGDSGGPVLRAIDGTGDVVVGVSSFNFSVGGSPPCSGGGSGSARIDTVVDFITATAPAQVYTTPTDTGTPDTDTPDTDTDTGTDTGAPPEPDDCGGCSTSGAAGWAWVWVWGLMWATQRRSRIRPS